MGFKKDFIKNVARFGGYTYFIQFLEFASTIILSRLISPEEYGFVALITVFSGFVYVFTNVGVRHAIIRNDYEDEKIGDFFGLTIWLGISLFILFSMLAYPIAVFYGNLALLVPTIIMGLTFLTQTVNFVPHAIANKNLDFNTIGRGRIFQTIFQVLFMIILALLDFSYWALIIPLTFSPVIQYLYFLKKVSFQRKMISIVEAWKLLVEIKSLVGNLTTSSIINYWSRNADNIVIGKFFGEASLGLYNRAYRFIYLALRLITSIFGTVLYPSLKKLKDEEGDINKEFLSVLGGISLLNFPLGFALILFARPIVLVLWGQDWIGVVQFMPYVGILILIQTIFSATSDFYVLQNKEKTVFLLSILSSAFMVSGILIGAFFSALHVIVFYTIANIVYLPVQVYIGFYKALGFNAKALANFWGPKFILCSLLAYFTFHDMYLFQVVASILYLIHIIYFQRKDLDKIISIVKRRK